MKTFDVISDLYLIKQSKISWTPTSLYCIVAGNISNDRNILYRYLESLQEHYKIVFFIDGELEHADYQGNLEASYRNLQKGISVLKNTVFMYENIIILDEVTLIASNGWTTFDFTNRSTVHETMDYLTSNGYITEDYANEIFKLAVADQHYMYNSIEQCQAMNECVNLVLITNTVPCPDFINHNDDFDGTVLGDTTGNNGITGCLSNDKKGKVHTWIFGKFHEPLDYNINGLRYVSNPGKGIDPDIYFPKRIEI